MPAVFILIGMGILYWSQVHAEPLPGWQGVVPVVMAATFILSGVLSIFQGRRTRAVEEEARRRLDAHRDAPWRARPEWQSAELVAPSTVDRSFLGFTILWNVLTWPLTFWVLSGRGEGQGPAWLVLLFPLIGLGMLAKVFADYRRGRRFGHTTLVLDPMPPRLGGVLRGTLRAEAGGGAGFERGVVVAVSCYRQHVVHTRDSDGDRRRSVERDLLWRDETRVREGTGGGGGLEVAFTFRLPEDLPPSHPLELDNRILWEVSAHGDLPGPDFDTAVEIPVFPPDGVADPEGIRRVAGAEPTAGPSPAPLGSGTAGGSGDEGGEEPPAWPYPAPVTRGIELVERPGAFELHFTAARTRRGALILGGVGVAVGVFGVGLLSTSLLWGAGLLALTALLLFGSVQQATNDTALHIREGRVEVTHDGIGMPADVAFPAANLAAVEVHLDPGSGSERGYAISLVPTSNEGLEELEDQVYRTADILSRLGMGEGHPAMDALEAAAERPRVLVAGQLRDKDEADWLAGRILAAARVEAGS